MDDFDKFFFWNRNCSAFGIRGANNDIRLLYCRTGKRGRPRKPRSRVPKDFMYATVHKKRVKGSVQKIGDRTIFGMDERVQSALRSSGCSRRVNSSFVERQNGTDRNRCCRKVWTLRRFDGRSGPCTPSMAAELADLDDQ